MPTKFIQKIFHYIGLVLTISVIACSGNEKQGSDSENDIQTSKQEHSSGMPADACALLTEDEAKAILGGAVTKGINTNTMCQYLSSADELSRAGESVSIELHPGAASEFDTYINNIEKDLKVKTTPVAGVGDKAVFAEGQLVVAKGNDFMIVIVGKKMGEEEQIAVEKSIAQHAIERLAQ